MTALDRLKSEFPESEGWGVRIPEEAKFTGKWWAYASRAGIDLYSNGYRTTPGAAVAALITAWRAAQPDRAAVRELVKAARMAHEALQRIGSALGPFDKGDGRRDMAAALAKDLESALAALPAHLQKAVAE